MFTEHYWRDRWYSIKEVRSQRGSLKGFEANGLAERDPLAAAEARRALDELERQDRLGFGHIIRIE